VYQGIKVTPFGPGPGHGMDPPLPHSPAKTHRIVVWHTTTASHAARLGLYCLHKGTYAHNTWSLLCEATKES
jgi:hypothetical protein